MNAARIVRDGLLGVLVLLVLVAGCVNTEITEPYQHEQEMSPQQILDGLLGEDLKAQLEAKDHLQELPPTEQLAILADVREQGNAKSRLLAVDVLARLAPEHRPALEMLQEMGKNDPDRFVQLKVRRELKKLEGQGSEKTGSAG